MPAQEAPLVLNHESSAVIKHLDLYQGVISRMAKNSVSSKQWCVVLISAIFALVAKDAKVDFAVLAIIPLFLFAFLDTYYLAMERKFIDANNAFLDRLEMNAVTPADLYRVKPERGTLPVAMWSAFWSPATYPFYFMLLVLLAGAAYIAEHGWTWIW